MTNIKFNYKGIEINGKLVKGSWGYDYKQTVMFIADGCSRELRDNFNVENDSDMMTDYFEDDSVIFNRNDKNFNDALNAWKKYEIKLVKRSFKNRPEEMDERINKIMAA